MNTPGGGVGGNGKAIFIAKHAFAGQSTQSQLSFVKDARIVASTNQTGVWWWGTCDGRDGWFPPAYVTLVQMPPPPGGGGIAPLMTPGMQQARMDLGLPIMQQQQQQQPQQQQHSFTQQQPRQPQQQQQIPFGQNSLQQQQQHPFMQQQQPMPYGQQPQQMMQSSYMQPQLQQAFGNPLQQQQQQQQQQYGQPTVVPLPVQQQSFVQPQPLTPTFGGFKTGEEDPFADLPAGPVVLAPDGTVVEVPATTATTVNSINDNVLSASGSGDSGGGGGVSASAMTVNTSNITSLAPPPAAMTLVSTPKVSMMTTPLDISALPSPSGGGMTTPKTGTSTSNLTPTPRATETTNIVESVTSSPSIPTASKKSSSPTNKKSSSPSKKNSSTSIIPSATGVGIGPSGARLPPLDPSLYADFTTWMQVGVGNARFFNIHEFLAKDDKEPRRKFYPIERVSPFWSLMGLDVYVERWQRSDGDSAGGGGGGNAISAIAGSISAGFSTLTLGAADGVGGVGDPTTASTATTTGGAVGAASTTTTKEAPAAFTAAPKYEQLAKALSFQCHIVQESERSMYSGAGGLKSTHPLDYLRQNQIGLEACIRLISMLPHSAGASGKSLDALFLNFINTFVNLIGNLQVNQQIVLPGGWQTPDSAHLCLYVLRNRGTSYSFSVINTGPDGLEYHLSNFDGTTGRQTKQLCLTVWDIPPDRVTDSTFWVLLFRLQVYPSKRNNAEFLYAKLLTSLNSRPLLSNNNADASGPPAVYYYPPATDKVAQQYHQLALLALTTIPEWNMPSSRYSSLLVRTAAVEIAYRGIEDARPSSMDPEDSRILQLTGRNLANYASTLDPAEFALAGNKNSGVDPTPMMNSLGKALSNTWELLDKLLSKLSVASSKPLDQHSIGGAEGGGDEQFEKGLLRSLRAGEGSAAHPFFGRLRRDNYEEVVKALMGDPRPDPILIPAVLTDEGMPDIAIDYHTAASSLLRICHACSLLLQQRRLVKNAPAFVASAAQYALTVTLPMPQLDPSICFWRKSPMRRETQTNLLFLIRRMCRIYSAATSSVQQSRGLVGIRTTAFACGACVADAIARVKCIDDPSPFSLHYSGLNEGPTRPFGFESGSFESLASNLPIYDPQLTALRFECLDYMRGMTIKDDGTWNPTIFNFDVSLTPHGGDLELMNHLSIELALPRPYPCTEAAMVTHAARLISGQNGAIMEILPEFEYFRDIVFHFKHSVSGATSTPEVEEGYIWLPPDATLKWTVKPISEENKTLQYHVTAFRGHHQDFVDPSAAGKNDQKNAFSSFLSLFSKSKVAQGKLSCADPTNIVNSCGDKFLKGKAKPVSVKNEDDILHLTNEELPTFGGVLTPADSERFLQFFTVPYLRIPLILDFFANGDPGRLVALKSKSLQLIVDAALFEPGMWKPSDYFEQVTEIPIVDEKKLQNLLSTPIGTLFNEIAKSPDVLVTSVIKMLERAVDMDVGKYVATSSSGPLILYTARLAVRIEGFLKFALRKCNTVGQPRPRGLEFMETWKVEKAMKDLRKTLDDRVIPMLEYWIDPIRCNSVDMSNLVHAHLIYLFKNYTYEEFNYRSISVLLTSQVFLSINHRFSNKAYDDLADSSDPSKPPPSIQIAQSEIFDIIQSKRYHLLQYMKNNPDDADAAMEAVVRVATGTGTRAERVDKKVLKQRRWNSIGHPTCYGRFVPDTEDEKLRDGSYRKPKQGENFETWMLRVTTKEVGIEVNVQISEFTLQNHKMMLLDPSIMNHKDFQYTKRTALAGASDVACAEVVHTANRYHWRLVGQRYDVMSWAPDKRNYHDIKGALNRNYTRAFPTKLSPRETWIAEVLLEKLPLILPGVTLYMSAEDQSNKPFAHLLGWIENPTSSKEGEFPFTHTMKEVVVSHNPPCVTVFNVKEYGRRHLRTLEYTSNMSLCLHEVTGEPYPDRVGGVLAMSGGVPMTTISPEPSLIITRALNSELGTQTLIPSRFMAGLIPACLVDKYVFWQSENDDIVGIEIRKDARDDEAALLGADTESSTRLKIKLTKHDGMDTSGFCNTAADAVVQRVAVVDSDEESENVDKNRPILTLLNIATAQGGILRKIGLLLSRLDNLSHVLMWSESEILNAQQECTIDLIELPRVNLSFRAKKIEKIDGSVEHRLYSNDNDGLYIATSIKARELVEMLLGSIDHFIVLQNEDNDLFVLIPGCALPRRLHVDGSHLSVQVLLDRRNQEWIGNMGEIRCYLYPVHSSKSFLITPSLASSMYLMTMFFITGAYQEVYKMVESCVSEDLTPEEAQIFNQLEFLGNDNHPDAHACRLKLSAVTVGLGDNSAMKCPWSVFEEMREYIRKYDFVSSACRLTTEEELLLLKMCTPTLGYRLPTELVNRNAYVSAVCNISTLPVGKTLSVKVGIDKPPVIESFDNGADTSILDNPKNCMIGSKLFGAAYSRPEEDQVAFGGLRALEFINSAIDHGVEITSASYGFPLMYDLLVGTVAFKLHPNDKTHNWGRILVRLVPPSDFKRKSAEMSALRILSENPSVASHPHVPKFQIDSAMSKFKGMFQGKDAVSRILNELHTFLTKQSIRSMLSFPAVNIESQSPAGVMTLRRPTSFFDYRLWVIPRVSDYSRDVFALDIQNCAAVNIPMAQIQAFSSKPLAPIKLDTFVVCLSRSQLREPSISGAVPFDLSASKAARTHCSEATSQRISTDIQKYAHSTNNATTPNLIGFTPADIESLHSNPAALKLATTQLAALIKALNGLMEFDRMSLGNLMARALAIATSVERSDAPGSVSEECNFLRFRLGQVSEREPTVWFEHLVASILSTTAEQDIRSLNPYLSAAAYKTVNSLTVVAMLASIRIGQSHRALSGLSLLVKQLRSVSSKNTLEEQKRLCQEISLQAAKVATDLTTERHFMRVSPAAVEFDPRFLVFEFTYSLMLRKSQVILVNKFLASLKSGKSMCHQMIMGAGKTTVVAPLLAMILADGKSLVTQVVPHALLDFSRGVMREKFAAVVRKPVFTFSFSRGTPITRDLYMKLCKARDSKAIICATPTSVKSFMLKFVEMMRHLERSKSGGPPKNSGFFLNRIAQRFREQSVVTELTVNPEDVFYCTEILKLFKEGVLLLDEVDLLLHPLKSELNWPIGDKALIDFTKSNKFGMGLRWDTQWHLLDAIFYASTKKMSVEFSDSREALTILDSIASTIQRGVHENKLQHTPHIVLLDKDFYNHELKPLLVRWQLLYLRSKRLPNIDDRHLLSYMANGPIQDKQAASAVSVALDDEYMKLLNLSHDLINNFIPHVLSKINRVSFGILSKADVKIAEETDPNMSMARRLAAVPFIGKDVPSRASQFSHPDVVIGLTIAAYRYEGMRMTDFIVCLQELRDMLDGEFGPYQKRPSALKWISWVDTAGGKVRGPRKVESTMSPVDEETDFLAAPAYAGVRPTDDIWPLHLLDLSDENHLSVTFKLLEFSPLCLKFYLDTFVFPLVLEHHGEKIAASGQDLGGDMLFSRRVGFSGTPSDLLPEELGQCHYDDGVDGQIYHYLTSDGIMSTRLLGADWSVTKILDGIIKSIPKFHVLIDTGALITGMSNYEVARYLLTNGLSTDFDGVVFLDHRDRKMILLRNGMHTVRLQQAGVPVHRRFSFYDQIHTTGMDIHQCIDARAVITLGKDMTFRDYAQGAFRMRGIGKGQTLEILIIPEVMERINKHVRLLLGARQMPSISNGNDLLSLGPAIPHGSQLVHVASWLTLNGMKSENMQFRLLCHQSVENVIRKRAFMILSAAYKELTAHAFSGRVKEIAAIAAAAKGQGNISADLGALFDGSRRLFNDDIAAIQSVLQGNASTSIGIDKLQKCLDVMTERLDFNVQNSIPVPTLLSETLTSTVKRTREFITNDYDKAVVDKIIMVLVNSETIAKRGTLASADDGAGDGDGGDHILQREEVSEEEVLQEQEEEEEEEEEEEVVNETPKKKKYSRDGENPTPWKVSCLSVPKQNMQIRGQNYQDPSWERSFFPSSEFSVKNSIFAKASSLKFPEYLYMSNNYYEKGWGLKTHRRLKNVIVIMEFCPSKTCLVEVAASSKSFSQAQERILQRAFTASDGKMMERIKISEMKEVLSAVDVIGDDEKDKEQFLAAINLDPNGTVSFDDLKQLLSQRVQYKIQAGRYYVALSLAEAQCMRLAIHGQHKVPIIAGTDAVVSLRTERTLLDTSAGFEDANPYQYTTAQACYRYIDSAVNFAPKEVNVLLRALQDEVPDERRNFFMEVRSNRRRKQTDPNGTPLKKVFSLQDEQNVLQFRIAVGRITALLKSRGMYARDAFAAFDTNRDGMLSGSELQAGLDWLGLKLDVMLLRQFMRELDKDKDGFINLEEFKQAVGWEEGEGETSVPTYNGVPLPPPPKDASLQHKLAIPAPVLAGIKMKVKNVARFRQVWNSQGSMSRVKGSVWEPDDHKSTFKSNRAYVYLGHYAGNGFDNPNRDGVPRLTLEITDTTGSWVGGSSWLPFVLDRYLPRPARYRLVWSITQGANPFYAWEPVPPSDNFVALGCIGTKTDKPPDVRMMRCVCKHWCTESKNVKSIWNDSGSGGREGSMWVFNSLSLLGFVNGHDAPARGKACDLKNHRFFLREYSCIKTNGVAPAPGT